MKPVRGPDQNHDAVSQNRSLFGCGKALDSLSMLHRPQPAVNTSLHKTRRAEPAWLWGIQCVLRCSCLVAAACMSARCQRLSSWELAADSQCKLCCTHLSTAACRSLEETEKTGTAVMCGSICSKALQSHCPC